MATTAERNGTVGMTERKLGEVREMLDKKLITQIEYDAQRKKILAGV